MPGDMAKYVNEKYDRLLSDKKNILRENPVPKNIDPVKILDHSIPKVVKGRQETLAVMDLETVKSKIRDVLGPMCRLWQLIKDSKTGKLRGERKATPYGRYY